MTRGKYIVIEGAEGVGKTTMVLKVAEALQAAGLPVRIMREPDSQNDLTARTLRRILLDPRYPTKTETEVLLFNAARAQSLDVIRQATANGVNCLVDRSYLTTLANQYYGRGDIKDYQRINEIIEFAVGDMQPDLMIVLDAPVDVLRKRLEERAVSHGKFGSLDEGFYERVRAGYLWEAQQRKLPIVYATKPVEEVFKEVWKHVAATLAVRDKKAATTAPTSVASVIAEKFQTSSLAEPARSVDTSEERAGESRPTPSEATVTPDERQAPLQKSKEKWLDKAEGKATTITEAGYERLEPIVTDPHSSVYSFSDQISPLTIAAAMARLSRRGDDMRITLLDEFIDKDDKDGDLLRRVITAYGDDSVQQLVGQYVVVENASNWLTKKLEWGRLAAYLEQSTRYIYFDQKDAEGKYRYYVPEELTGEVRELYIKTLDTIFDVYSDLVQKMTDYVRANSTVPKAEQDAAWRSATKAQACDAVRPLLPVATKSTVGIFASGQALESLIMHLLSDDMPEARTVGQQILDEVRKTTPALFERADKPERGGAFIAYRSETRADMKKVAEKYLPASYTDPSEPVTLVGYSPHNELDIVADMLYEHSDMPLVKIRSEVTSWPYDRKLEVFNTYIGKRLNRRHRPGRALENIHYTWDLVCDYGIFRDLQRHRIVDDLEWQQLTPRYGFDTPKLVEEAGLADAFASCFDLSLRLHSVMQAAGCTLQSQYATLLGHKMRWRVTMNAREAMHFNELRTAPQGHPGYRKLVGQMHEKLAEVHPLLGAAMKFVNQDEDPELTRLAAERYTAFKLAKLDKKKQK
jgi:dTMP kinase